MNWLDTACGPDSIRNILKNAGHWPTDCTELLSELIQIDIDRIWMSWNKILPKLAEKASASEILEAFQLLPRLENYFDQCLPGMSPIQFGELANREFRARTSWGDAIGPAHYEQDFGLVVSAKPHQTPCLVRCDVDGSSHFQMNEAFPLRGRTILGRQRSRDTGSYLLEELPAGNRIVIAGRVESKISREQLAVQALTPSYALISNLSSINPVVMSSGCLVETNTSKIAEFPFLIQLPGRRLHFYRHECS